MVEELEGLGGMFAVAAVGSAIQGGGGGGDTAAPISPVVWGSA